MLTLFHDAAVYIPMYIAPDLQAYRTDTFEGWVKQPAEIGPVIFSNTSPELRANSPRSGPLRMMVPASTGCSGVVSPPV